MNSIAAPDSDLLAGLAAAAGAVPELRGTAPASGGSVAPGVLGAQAAAGSPSAAGPQGAAGSQGGGGGPQAAAHAIPGMDAAIQRWFLDNGALKIRFNDALLQAERAVARGDTTGCQQLDAAARALSAPLPALERLSPAGQRLAAAMRTPLTTFATAATACLAKDFAAAQAALDSGVVQHADAQETVDEILDGDL